MAKSPAPKLSRPVVLVVRNPDQGDEFVVEGGEVEVMDLDLGNGLSPDELTPANRYELEEIVTAWLGQLERLNLSKQSTVRVHVRRIADDYLRLTGTSLVDLEAYLAKSFKELGGGSFYSDDINITEVERAADVFEGITE